jgi:SAM-dependent methyltransferase
MQEFSSQQLDFLKKALDDKTRQAVLHKSFKPRFINFFEKVLSEYGLADKLEAAKANREKVRFLDYGCGEGLYLHDIADRLEHKGLLQAANLNGIDINPATITTADEFARRAKPPRPYLNFVLQDGRLPLSENPALKLNGEAQFDFVYSLVTFMYIPEARKHLEKLYREDLKPGGVVLLRDLVVREEYDRVLMIHPALLPAIKFYTNLVRKVNGGLSIASDAAAWFESFGAEKVEQILDGVDASGKNEEEMGMLRQIIMITRNMKAQMIAEGLTTDKAFEEIFEQVYKELNQSSRARVHYMVTIARKPETVQF